MKGIEHLLEDFLVYQPPEVELVEVRVEIGFAGSETGGNTPDWTPTEGRWE